MVLVDHHFWTRCRAVGVGIRLPDQLAIDLLDWTNHRRPNSSVCGFDARNLCSRYSPTESEKVTQRDG
jgi:hypothetical protein